MRILNIYYKNINSLEGEGRLDFDQGPIAESGVFAITGPNGSGKSSILDVITLGLYGETFRFDKPAEHVITKQASESFAQVEFLLGGERFRSSWQVSRPAASSEDQLLRPEMSLMRMDGEQQLLAETPNLVRNQIAELTGMDFHKFSKSMVLPQGDFAAFLNALDSERMDILEKISGSEIYADFRRQSELKHQQAQQRLAQIQQDIASVPLLADELLQSAELDLQDFKEQLTEHQQEQQAVQQHLSAFKEVLGIEAEQQQLARQTAQVQQTIDGLELDLRRIADVQQAAQLRGELAVIDDKQQQLTQLQHSLAGYRQELSSLQRQLNEHPHDQSQAVTGKSLGAQKQAIDTLKLKVSELKLELPRETASVQAVQQQLDEKKITLAEVEDWLQQHQADVVLLEDFPAVAQLRNLRSEIKSLSGKQKTQANWSKNTSATMKKNQSALSEAQAAVTELKAKIEQAQTNLNTWGQGKTLDELKELLLEQQQRVNDFQELNALAEVNLRLTKKGFFNWFSRKKIEEQNDEGLLEARIDALRLELSKEENIGRALEQAISNEAMLKKMRSDRNKLVDGKPCFLCGSLNHPYVSKPPLETNSKQALVDQRAKMQSLKRAVDSVSAQLSEAKKNATKLSAKQQFLQQKRSQWRVLANRLNVVVAELNIDNLSLQKSLLLEETEELNKIKNLVKEHAQLQRNIAKWTAEIDSKQASLQKITAAATQLEAAWNERPPEQLEIEQGFNQSKAEEKILAEKVEHQLKLLGEKMPGKGKENAVFDRLNARRQDYQIRQLRQKGLQEEIAALQERLQASQSKIIRYQQQMTDSLAALQTEEGVGLHLAVMEKQKLIVEQEQRLEELKAGFERELETLLSKTGGSLNDIEDLRAALALMDKQPEIEQGLTQAHTELLRLNEALANVDAKLQRAYAGMLDVPTEVELKAQQRQISERIDICEHEIRALENKLDKQQQYQQKYQSFQVLLDEQQAILAQAVTELNSIDEDQAGFRRRIQQLLVDKLLMQTNQILEKLSGRYYVRSIASEYGLALEIEDTKQKNQRRLPKTLSGGESFVVSLALALALAEVANNGKAIDSLFLDEGFGNLDAEALYLALSTLEGLKTQGKIVGVISHVDGVKKRIKTQIELVKKANGLSELKMVA